MSFNEGQESVCKAQSCSLSGGEAHVDVNEIEIGELQGNEPPFVIVLSIPSHANLY